MPKFLLHQTSGSDSQASSASSKSWYLCGTWNKQFSFQTGLLVMVMFILIIGCSLEANGRTDLVCFIFMPLLLKTYVSLCCLYL